MATTPAPGIVTTGDLGNDFAIGTKVPGKVTWKGGRNLYQSADGTWHAVNAPDLGTTDWAWLIIGWSITALGFFIIGYYWQVKPGPWMAGVAAIAVVFAIGWAAHYVWRFYVRTPNAMRYPDQLQRPRR